jgi:hypothetical protein
MLRATAISGVAHQEQKPLVGVGRLDDGVHQGLEQLRDVLDLHQALAELVQLAQAGDLAAVGLVSLARAEGLVVDREHQLQRAEREPVVVQQLGPALLLAVDGDLPLPVDFREVEIPPVEDDLRVVVGYARALYADIVASSSAHRGDLLVDGEDARLARAG